MIGQHEILHTKYYTDRTINLCTISETEILDTFHSLNLITGARLDSLLPEFLKLFLSVLIKPLHYSVDMF